MMILRVLSNWDSSASFFLYQHLAFTRFWSWQNPYNLTAVLRWLSKVSSEHMFIRTVFCVVNDYQVQQMLSLFSLLHCANFITWLLCLMVVYISILVLHGHWKKILLVLMQIFSNLVCHLSLLLYRNYFFLDHWKEFKLCYHFHF